MKEKRTYYVGTYHSYLAEIRSRDLERKNHIFVNSIEKFAGLPRDIEIVSVGPREASREIVIELRCRGYTNTRR